VNEADRNAHGTPVSRRRFAGALVAAAPLAVSGGGAAQADSNAKGARLSMLAETFDAAERAAPPRRAREIRTLGYHTAGDGGGARYAWVADEVTDSRLWQLE
jgi:hypothetical protein